MGVINPVIMLPGAWFDFGVALDVPTDLSGSGVLYINPGPTAIPSYCFYTGTSTTATAFFRMVGVSIPDSVTSIGTGAFQGWSSATSLTLPDSVTSIDNSAFLGWSSATSLTIPDSVTSIGSNAFNGWSSATDIYISPTTPPTATTSSFSGIPNTATFHVPAGSIPAYQAAVGYPNEVERYQEIV